MYFSSATTKIGISRQWQIQGGADGMRPPRVQILSFWPQVLSIKESYFSNSSSIPNKTNRLENLVFTIRCQ